MFLIHSTQFNAPSPRHTKTFWPWSQRCPCVFCTVVCSCCSFTWTLQIPPALSFLFEPPGETAPFLLHLLSTGLIASHLPFMRIFSLPELPLIVSYLFFSSRCFAWCRYCFLLLGRFQIMSILPSRLKFAHDSVMASSTVVDASLYAVEKHKSLFGVRSVEKSDALNVFSAQQEQVHGCVSVMTCLQSVIGRSSQSNSRTLQHGLLEDYYWMDLQSYTHRQTSRGRLNRLQTLLFLYLYNNDNYKMRFVIQLKFLQ